MAQDFHAAFGLGADDKHIATVGADGVALAAIQGLNRKLEDTIQAQEARIDQLTSAVAELKTMVHNLNQKLAQGSPTSGRREQTGTPMPGDR
jgi:cell division protein FtsB